MRFHLVGERALLVELDSSEQTVALHAELLRRRAGGRLPQVREIVPAELTVLLDGVGGVEGPRRLAARLAAWKIPPVAECPGTLIELPVRYEGADLAAVAALWRADPKEVAEIHSSVEFRVAFCGFAPGFAYLTGLPERLAVPRRATPRGSLPAGSVALAGSYTGIYPRSSPGGWQLIGVTDAVLWDTCRQPAALLTPGARVRFLPVGR